MAWPQPGRRRPRGERNALIVGLAGDGEKPGEIARRFAISKHVRRVLEQHVVVASGPAA